MRLLMTSASFYPSQEGGASNALFWIARGLIKAGVKVRVVTTSRLIDDSTIPLDTWTKVDDVDVIYKHVKHYRVSAKLIDWKELSSCDAFMTTGLCEIPNFLSILIAIQKHKKVIISPRGELFDSAIYNRGFIRGKIKLAFFKIQNCLFGHKVIYHSTSQQETAAIRTVLGDKCKIKLITNYLILAPKLPDELRHDYLLFIGRIVPIKALDKLIKGLSMSELFMHSDIQFWLAGDTNTSYFRTLQEIVDNLGLNEKVRFLGHITGKDKDVLYAKAKCLYLVSESENFGNVVVESLAQGTPAIVSHGAPWELLIERKAGFWIENTPEEIAKTTDILLSFSNAEYYQLRQSAYELSKEYNMYDNVYKWVELLTE